MDLSQEEARLLTKVKDFAREHGYRLNPDGEAVGRVIRGMAMLEHKKGQPYCPCRLITGKPEIDRKNICPCEHHAQEIEKNGHCHCMLLYRKD